MSDFISEFVVGGTVCACVGGWVLGCVRALCVRARCAHTGAQVGVLLGQVLALMDPFPVALEEDLQCGLGPAAQLDGVALDDVGVVGLLQEAGQGPGLEGLAPGPWDTHAGTRSLYTSIHKVTVPLAELYSC